MESNYSSAKAKTVNAGPFRLLTTLCHLWRSHFASAHARRRRDTHALVSSAESLETRSLLTPAAIFDFAAIASDLSPTERFFGSNNFAHAPYTVIRYGEGTITSLTELPNAASAHAASGPLTFRFGSNDPNKPVEVVTLSTFDDGISDGLANQVYTADGVNDNPTVTLFLNGQPVATGTVKKLSLQTTPQLVITSPASAPSELQLTAAAGKDPAIYKELMMATGRTGLLRFTLSSFSRQGHWAGAADGSLYNSTGTTRISSFSVDYGDLPDPAFRTLLTQDGARHRLWGTLMLGNSVTAEANGKPSPAANLDNDDGVILPALRVGTDATASVTVSGGSGFLDGWIDFNQDGDFDDADEHVLDDRSVTTGVNKVRISVPVNAIVGSSYARFRLSSTAVESPRGLAIGGEVEDYRANILLPTPILTPPPAATTALQRPKIAWSPVVGATNYEIDISNLSTGVNAYHIATVTGTSYTPTVDLGIGVFRLRVRAVQSLRTSAWTAGYDFTINTRAAFNAVARVIENQYPTLTWSPISGAVRYEILITDLRGNGVSDIHDQNILGTSFTPASKMPLASYNASVRGIAADGTAGDWSLNVEFEILSSPATINGPEAATVAQRPTITWTAVEGAVSYELMIKNLATPGIAPVIVASTTNQFTPAADLGIGTFYVWVRAVTANGQMRSWSSIYRFKISTPVTIVQPAAVMNSGRPTIYFRRITGAVRYEVWIRNVTTGGSTVVRDANITATRWTSASDLPISDYQFLVRGIDATGQLANWGSVNFRVATAPSPIRPSASTATFDRTPTFTWRAVAGAVSYSFELSNMTSGEMVRTVQNLKTPTWTEPTDLPIGNYRWLSRAIGARELAANWSKPTDFSIGGVATFLTRPGVFGTTPTLEWQSAGDAAGYYELRINRIDVPQSNVVHETRITGNNFTISTPLVNGGSYRAWVRAISTSGELGPWSVFLNFSVRST